MKYRLHYHLILGAVLLAGLLPGSLTWAGPVSEYQLKAAFIFNFLQFTEWPPEAFPQEQTPYRIGILGQDNFGDAFEAVKDKKINGRAIEVVRLGSFPAAEAAALGSCHILFICPSESEELPHIFAAVKHKPVLTIGEMPNFCEWGGMINFVMEDRKVRFEINLTEAEAAKLKFRAKLLKLAKRVIGG